MAVKIKKERPKYQTVEDDHVFSCDLRKFQTSADICRNRKEKRRKGCCSCRQIIVKEGICQLAQ